MKCEFLKVVTKKQWRDFIRLPWKIYQGNPYWVPPLQKAVLDSFDLQKNPFFQHALFFPIIAYRGSECVGRIVGMIDQTHNEFHQEKVVIFGFFECIDDKEVAAGLFKSVLDWGRQQGMGILRGPIHFSTNHECGLLVEGFEDAPTVMTTYHPPYYQKLLEQCDLHGVKDLFAYNVYGDKKIDDRLIRHIDRIRKRASVQIRCLEDKNFQSEIEKIFAVYQDAWANNWGFVPMQKEEFMHLANELKFIYDPNLCLMVELNHELIGFGLCLPDVNQALKDVTHGKLLSFGFLKFLWNFKGPGRKKTVNRCRIITLGIKSQYRELGIGPLIYSEYLKRGPELGYPVGEASWILEDNRPMNQALKLMSAERSKVYRIYERPCEL